MTITEAAILGIIQGVTEFLPISSSGHLVLTDALLGTSDQSVSFEIWLHLGTLAAVIVYFFPRLIGLVTCPFRRSESAQVAEQRKLLVAVIIGTIPAVVLGLLFKSSIEAAFSSPHLTSAMLIITGIILLATGFAVNRDRPLGAGRAIVIGLAQALAMLPGISRSGSTIAAGMFLGVDPARAAEYSFLLAVPAIGGAFLLDMVSTGGAFLDADTAVRYGVGTFTSFIFGIASIAVLLRIIRRGKFRYFGIYCFIVGVVSFLLVK
jgi:undecaprenyl-diphosphatase